jgi:hypothetical protein
MSERELYSNRYSMRKAPQPRQMYNPQPAKRKKRIGRPPKNKTPTVVPSKDRSDIRLRVRLGTIYEDESNKNCVCKEAQHQAVGVIGELSSLLLDHQTELCHVTQVLKKMKEDIQGLQDQIHRLESQKRLYLPLFEPDSPMENVSVISLTSSASDMEECTPNEPTRVCTSPVQVIHHISSTEPYSQEQLYEKQKTKNKKKETDVMSMFEDQSQLMMEVRNSS